MLSTRNKKRFDKSFNVRNEDNKSDYDDDEDCLKCNITIESKLNSEPHEEEWKAYKQYNIDNHPYR